MSENLMPETKAPSWQTMLAFLIPMMLSNFLQSISGTISSILLGQFIGVHALAAVSIFFPVLFFMISFIIGMGNASTVLIGQAYGARDERQLKAVVGTSLSFTFLLGVALAGLGIFFREKIFQAIGTPPDIFAIAVSYATCLFVGLPILFPYIMYTTFLRGTGDSKTPFYFLLISTGLTLMLTPVLTLGWLGFPRLGINGAAVSLIGAELITFILLLLYLQRIHHPLRLDKQAVRHLKINPAILKLMFKIGIPTGIQMIMISLSAIALMALVNQYGSNATAAYGAANQIISYVQMPAISIGMTVAIFGAQAIGAGKMNGLRHILHTGLKLNLVISGTLILCTYLFSKSILSWFITEKGALEIAMDLLVMTLWSYLLFGNMSVLTGMMRSSGDVFWPTLLSVLNIWCIQVPSAFLLSKFSPLGIKGIWLSYPLAFAGGLLAQTVYYHFFWKKKEKVRLIPAQTTSTQK
jgi:putative MATE family efflux protein